MRACRWSQHRGTVAAERRELALRGVGQLAVSGQTRIARDPGQGRQSRRRRLRAETVNLDMSALGGATVYASSAIEVNLSGMGSATVDGKPAQRNATTDGVVKVNWRRAARAISRSCYCALP